MSAVLIALILVILVIAFGFSVLGVALGVLGALIWWSVVGLVVGGLGRLVASGRRVTSLTATILYGIAGSILGGIIGRDLLSVGWVGQFLTAVVVAAILVVITVPRSPRY
jgi:uncharacterized membrane protein YeaQ/YmgE (transglycosylase-associated protein family)